MLQDIGLNSQRASSTFPFLGPTLYIEQQQLDIYQKGESRDSIQIPSDGSQQCIENRSMQIDQLKATFPNRNSKSFSRRRAQNSQEKRNDSQSIKKYEGNVFIKNLLKNSHIAYFKNILFEHSYVLPTKLKNLLATESYLTEDISKKKIATNNQQVPWFIFLPGDRRMIIWDQISLIMSFICLWICPFVSCFNTVVLLYHAFEILIILYLVLDIIICFNRAIIDEGEIIAERKIISQNYMHNHFLQDLISIICWLLCCFEIYRVTIANEIMFLIQLSLVLTKLKKNYANYIEQLYLKGAFSNVTDIISLVFSIYFFAHFMACAWHYIGIQTDSLGNTWISKYDLLDQNEYYRYNYSFYWATVTMVTVGYGDIIPQNYVEMIFVNFIILVSSFMYAYSLNSIGIILKSYNDQREKYTRQLIMINSYMRKNQIDETIQNRVRNYIKYQMGSQYNENSDSVNQFINDLPIGLRNELSSDLQTKIISKMKILNQIFSKQTTKALINQLKLTKLTPNDFVYHRGDPNEQNLFYVDEGEINIIEENSKKVLEVKRKGDVFGEYQFFTGLTPKCSAISTEFSIVYQIKRSDFVNLIRYFQSDFEKFNNIKDGILFNQSFSIFFKSCNICQRMSHISIECPLLTYKPNLEQRIKKELFHSNQERNHTYLRQNQKQQFRCLFKEIQASIKQFQQKQDMQVAAIETVDGSSVKLESPLIMVRPTKSKKTTIQPQYQKGISEYEDEESQLQVQTSMQERQEKKIQRKSAFVNTIIVRKLEQQKKTHYRPNQPHSTSLDIKTFENQNILDEFKFELQFHCNDLDKLQNYLHYKAHGNADVVVRNFEQIRKKKNKNNFKGKNLQANAYTFSQNVVQKIINSTKIFIKMS